MPRRTSLDLLVPLALSAAIVASSPAAGALTAALRTALPAQFVVVISVIVIASAGAAVGSALMRIRSGRRWRYALIAAAVATAATYARAATTGSAESDAVERFHFVEYGVLAWLFYRSWRRAGGSSPAALTLLSGLIVAVVDEWVQWFVPVRIGELRDVLIDVVAVACGLCCSVAVDPPGARGQPLFASRPHVPGTALLAAAAVVALAFFVDTIHTGYEVRTRDRAAFRSHFDSDALRSLSRDRAVRWPVQPPTTLRRYSREDQYLSEGLWHVQRRNSAWADGDAFAAWHENLILEEFFAPVLDTRSYQAGSPSRWSTPQREDAERLAAGRADPYISSAERLPIVVWPRWLFQLCAALLASGLCALDALSRGWRRQSKPAEART